MKKGIKILCLMLMVVGIVGCEKSDGGVQNTGMELRDTIQRANTGVEQEWEVDHPYQGDSTYTVVGGGILNSSYKRTGNRERVTMFGAELLIDTRYEGDYETELDVSNEKVGHENGIERYFVRVIDYENGNKVSDKRY